MTHRKMTMAELYAKLSRERARGLLAIAAILCLTCVFLESLAWDSWGRKEPFYPAFRGIPLGELSPHAMGILVGVLGLLPLLLLLGMLLESRGRDLRPTHLLELERADWDELKPGEVRWIRYRVSRCREVSPAGLGAEAPAPQEEHEMLHGSEDVIPPRILLLVGKHLSRKLAVDALEL